MRTKIVCLSDTHGLHRQVSIPESDILIHAGDLTGLDKSLNSIREFDEWLGELPHSHKIVVPGNHDFAFEENPFPQSLFRNATVLINQEIRILGLKIWGSPVTPLYGGAFGLSSAADRRKLYANVPAGLDVLVTHGPPYGILDYAPNGIHLGCRELLKTVERTNPRVHIFGHIHGAHSVCTGPPTTFVNAALVGVNDLVTHAPIVVEINRD